MFQSHIILTQTFIEEEKLIKLVTYFFAKEQKFEKSIHEIIKSCKFETEEDKIKIVYKGGEITEEQLDLAFEHAKNQQTVSVLSYEKKKDFRDNLMSLYQHYEKPNLLFLGNLNEYSKDLQEGMLKLLEEPPANLIIVLLAHNSTEVLPTISSRSRFYALPKDKVIKLMDQKLLKKTKAHLPVVSDVMKALLNGSFKASELDLKNVSREELDFWLWQVGVYLEAVFKAEPVNNVALIIEKILHARKLNQENLQKKFVLGWLE